MSYLVVVVAAIAAFALGAIWYMVLRGPWVEASGVETDSSGHPKNGSNPVPYVLAAVALILVAGMMRHVFAQAGIDAPGKGFLAGLGIGLFIVSPWIFINNAYGMRPTKLSLIDGGYATAGCSVIGLVLTLF